MPGPLDGIRVIDLTQGLCGPFATLRMGDAGADVVKLEPPTGDSARRMGPPFLGDESALFLSLNRNKRSAVVDLEDRSGRAALNQSKNYQRQKRQTTLNYSNSFLDAELSRVEITTVQHMCNRAFFWREWRWVDARLLDVYDKVEPDQVIMIGSAEHTRLTRRFALEGRPGVLALSKVLLELDGRVVLISDGC